MYDIAALLNTFVAKSAEPYGKEYSVRWRNGVADRDRFLLSIHKLALAESATHARQKLEDLMQQLCCPVESSQALWDFWTNTCVVHFGYEQASSGQANVKIYFELTAQDQVDLCREQLIHVAVKWNPSEPDHAALSRYSLVPCDSRNELFKQLSQHCPPRFLPTLENLVDEALTRCDVRELMLLAVTDDNSPRRSCDLNLYNSQLTIGEVQSDLVELAALNNCQEDDWLSSHQSSQLGHLAAGRDRDQDDFVTLYYGIETH